MSTRATLVNCHPILACVSPPAKKTWPSDTEGEQLHSKAHALKAFV